MCNTAIAFGSTQIVNILRGAAHGMSIVTHEETTLKEK